MLSGFSLRVSPGETVAFVGVSGSGKSTVANIVPRFYDVTAGRGSHRRTRRPRGHARVASPPDRCRVRRVLPLLRQRAGEHRLRQARRHEPSRSRPPPGRPQAHGFIEELPRGYDTVVGERGLTLSGGQRQRVALARAILSDPRILILDDATSAVDARVEERIHSALREVMKGRTTLLVAHRRSSLNIADKIAVIDGGRVVAFGSHEELSATSALYRGLLSGLEEDEAEAVGDRIEALATLSPLASVASKQGRQPTAFRSVGAASMGPGLRTGGGWRLNLAPTPELLARVAALRPVRDFPTLDLEAETRHEHHFSLRKLLGRYRGPLALGLVLVALDAVASLMGPVLIKEGIDKGVATSSLAAVLVASGIYLAITVADLFDEIGSTFVTGRTAQRIMMSLRIAIWAQLQRLSLDYYEREMAGRIMTRMTTDVDQFESLIENGLLSALVSHLHLRGRGRRSCPAQRPSRPYHHERGRPARVRHGRVPPQDSPRLRPRPRAARGRQR